jgi:hypothetical protein
MRPAILSVGFGALAIIAVASWQAAKSGEAASFFLVIGIPVSIIQFEVARPKVTGQDSRLIRVFRAALTLSFRRM